MPSLGFSQRLKQQRQGLGWSQGQVAERADISQRHLSWLETDKARPSRVMVLQLAEAFQLGKRDTNDWLLAAGFAPLFGNRPLHHPDMEPIRNALERLLQQQEPFPALVMDAHWNLVSANRGLLRLVGALGLELPQPANLIRLFFGELRPFVLNFAPLAAELIARLHRDPSVEAQSLLVDLPKLPPATEANGLPVLPTHLRLPDGQELRFMTLLASLGSPQDLTAEALRVECFMPMDAGTRGWFAYSA
jgi:transcriptional regulator with XRE-family HTH domain